MGRIKCNWYVYVAHGYMFRIKCEAYYINQLYKDNAIEQYQKMGTKEECIEICECFNKKRRKNYAETKRI